MGSVLPESHAHSSPDAPYGFQEQIRLTKDADTKAVVSDGSGNSAIINRDELIRQASTPQQAPQRGDDAVMSSKVLNLAAEAPQLRPANEELAKKAAPLSEMLIDFLSSEKTAGPIEEEDTSQLSTALDDELRDLFEPGQSSNKFKLSEDA